MTVNARNAVALSGVSAINGITKATLSAINGQTIDAGGGGGSPIANDNFTDTDGVNLNAHTADSGGSWTYGTGSTGSLLINGNALGEGAPTPWAYPSTGTPATAEYDIQGTINSAGTSLALIGRLQTGSPDFYYCYYNTGATRWELYKLVSGSPTLLGNYTGDVPTSSRVVKLEIRNAAKKVFIDGVERISSADNAITGAGRPGVGSVGGSGTIDTWSATNA